MLSEQDRKEMFEDAMSKERQRAFEEAAKRAEAIEQRYLMSLTPDKVIDFLMNVQEVTGSFPISKKVSTGIETSNFRL